MDNLENGHEQGIVGITGASSGIGLELACLASATAATRFLLRTGRSPGEVAPEWDQRDVADAGGAGGKSVCGCAISRA